MFTTFGSNAAWQLQSKNGAIFVQRGPGIFFCRKIGPDILPLETLMEQLTGTPLVVHVEGNNNVQHFHDRYPVWDTSEGLEGIDPLNTRSQPPSPSLIVPNMIEEAHVAHADRELEIEEQDVPRGAGRRNRLNRADPRTMMLSWAKDKVLEKVPELNPATVHFLLRAEKLRIILLERS